MKFYTLLFILLFAIPFTSHSQNGYASFGLSVQTGKNSNEVVGGYVSFGAIQNQMGFGAIVDLYTFDKDKTKFAIAALDMRAYLSKTLPGPYISIQPGFAVYNERVLNTVVKGSFCFAAMAGFAGKMPKGWGVNFSAGFQYTSFKSGTVRTEGKGGKIQVGLLF